MKRYTRLILAWSVASAPRTGFGWGFGAKSNNDNNDNNNNTSFGAGFKSMTGFAIRASAFKRRHRGKGQYEFARREAEKFLEAEVPLNATNLWIEEGTNALALAQLLNFFEIEPDVSLLSLITNKLVRMLDDTTIDSATRLSVAIVLLQRGEMHMERIFSAVGDILNTVKRDEFSHSGNISNFDEGLRTWNVIELAAKVMQRSGKHAPSVLNETLVRMTMTQLERTPVTELPHLQTSLLRVYGWMVRIGKVDEANHVLVALVEHTGEFHSFDFSTLMNSCLRHHQLCPLPLPLLHRMVNVGLRYSTTANGRDAASVLASAAKILGSLDAGKNGVMQRDVRELGGKMNMLLGEYEPRVLRFLDATDKLHWTHCDDVTSIVFAYEMGGRLRYKHVFIAYQAYVALNVGRFEPQQLAMAAGILRRSQLLSQKLAVKLGERIETVLGEFSLSEISHICATFAPMSPAWMPEAKAVASRLLTPECSSYTKLTLAMAFPDDDTLHSQINYNEISGRQLVDAMTLAKGIQFEGPIVAELMARLNAAQERFSPDDIRMVQASGRQDLQAACMMYLSSRFAESEWTNDTLYSLPLASGIPHARDPIKALAAAKAVSISPEQFVSLVELLTGVFGEESNEAIVNFVVTGGEELLGEKKIRLGTVVRYLEAVRPLCKMHPNGKWMACFNEVMLHSIRHMKVKEMRSLLWSLREVFGDVAHQPLLQQTLHEIVSGPYSQLTHPDDEAAQITLLIAYMQNGMLQPPLKESTPMVTSVRNNAATYSLELKNAVMDMPIPKEAETKRLGRFTLKAVRALETSNSSMTPPQQDLNAALDTDPFATPSPTGAAGVMTTPSSCNMETAHVPSNPTASSAPAEVPRIHTTNVMSQEITPSSLEGASDIDMNTKQQQQHTEDSLSVSQSDSKPASQSGMRLWNLFGISANACAKQKTTCESTPPQPTTKPPENLDAAESTGGSSYMKLFSPIETPQQETCLSEVKGNNETDEQLRPRRTALSRTGAHNSASDAGAVPTASSSFGHKPCQFGHDDWNTPLDKTTSVDTPQSSSWSSFWGAIKQPTTFAQGHNMEGGYNSSGTPLHMQPSVLTFGGNSDQFGVSNRYRQQQHHPQQQVPAQTVNTPMMQQQQQQQQQAPPGYRMTPRGGMATPGNHLFVSPASSSRPRPLMTKTNLATKTQQPTTSTLSDDINQMYSKNASGAQQGISNFMKKTGLTKVKGYNMGLTNAETSVGDKKGFWADVVGKSARRSKNDNRRLNKNQKSLSEWLSAPSARKVDNSRKGRGASPVVSTVKGNSKDKGKRGSGRDNVAMTTATPTRGGNAARGKGANTKVTSSKVTGGAATKGTMAKTATKRASKSSVKTTQAKLKKTTTTATTTTKKNEKKPVHKKANASTNAAAANAKKDSVKKSLKKGKNRGKGK